MTDDAALDVRGLQKTFGDVRAIDGLDLTVATGAGPWPRRTERRGKDDAASHPVRARRARRRAS